MLYEVTLAWRPLDGGIQFDTVQVEAPDPASAHQKAGWDFPRHKLENKLWSEVNPLKDLRKSEEQK